MKSKTRKNMASNDLGVEILLILDKFKVISENDEINTLIDKFNNCDSIEQQITILHLFPGIMVTAPKIVNRAVLKILVNLFLATNSKHPIKKSILRIFSGAKSFENDLSDELGSQLLEILNFENRNLVVNNINDCFNNFSGGVQAVSLILDKIFPILVETLKYYYNELSIATSPVLIQELFKDIHNSTRAIVAVSQQCQNINSILEKNIDDLVDICIKILKNQDILYDTKNNCGILLTISANIALKNGFEILLQTCIDENSQIFDNKIKFEDLNNEIIITCIFSGILNTVKPEKLSEKSIFQMTQRLLNISKNSADKPSVILGANRTLLLISRVLGALSFENFVKILKILLEHIWISLDHNIDTIRHVSKNILTNLVKTTIKNNEENRDNNVALNLIIDSVLSLPVLKNGRYIALSIVSNEVGFGILLKKDSNFVDRLRNLAQESSISTYVMSCYENLMKNSLRETSEDIWLKIWVFPLISELENDQQITEKDSCYQKFLISAIKLRPSIINSILTRWSIKNEVQFSSLLKCALIARKIGTEINGQNKWRGMLDYALLDLAICHQNDEIRVLSLSLISESLKSTEIFTEFELNFVVKFLHFNINTQLPSTRQRILFLIKKILTRFFDSFYAIIRNISKPNNVEKILNQKKYYEEFIFNLRRCIFDSLFPGANFSRRIICLEVLTLLEPILKNFKMEEQIFWQQSEVEALQICLNDSYECNKQLAVNLLKNCPVRLLKLHTPENTKNFIKNALKLSKSIKPADTITAAYLLEVSMYSNVINDVLKEFLNEKDNFLSEYLMINSLINHLNQQIETGSENLLKAAGSGPMYGTLFCIRHLMEKYLFASNLTEKNWKHLIEQIIEICFKISEIVCPVVNSSSPEGHLPMDHETVNSTDPENSTDDVITAQMLLVCSWRSIKEVSLLLGETTLKGKIIGENENGFISQEEILRIGEHFTVLLTETKHRGAFEQAYVGFNKLCTRLWRCKSEKLHQLPIVWLNDIISAISGEKSVQNNKLCATRRSAGVPFMIQAIISSELQSGSSTNFHQCMEKLLIFANSSDENIEKRTHSMNILRALYRHTQLGEDISPYVAQGVIVSITGFCKKSWAERNAATLLFSSLMTRIFGVQRTKDTDQLNIRNKMTGRVFFQRYPILYKFLLDLLQELTEESCPHYKIISLYPILLLLARLYPSTAEEKDFEYNLEGFVPYVQICAKNKTLKTRELAAKALVPLVPTQNHEILVRKLFVLLQNQNLPKNYIHGILLQIYHLTKISKLNNFENEVKNTIWLLNYSAPKDCLIITTLYIQIIYNFMTKNAEISNLKEIYSIVYSLHIWIQKNNILGSSEYYIQSANLLLFIQNKNQDISEIISFIFQNLRENKVTQNFILNFLINLIYNEENSVFINYLELPDLKKHLVKSLPQDFKIKLINNIKNQHESLTELLQNLAENTENFLPKIIFILNNYTSQNFENCVNFLQKYPEDQEIYNSVITSFPNFVKSTENLLQILEIILETSLKYEFICRYYSARTILNLKPIIFGETPVNLDILIKIWNIIMILLSDSEPVVRNTISQLASSNPIAEKAREELLLKCIEVVQKISKDKCISLLIFWGTTVFNNDTNNDDIEQQVFEKGETSTYIEDMCLSNLCSKYLKNFNNSEISCTKITSIILGDSIWNDFEISKQNLVTILEEIANFEKPNDYFESKTSFLENLDVYNKYKISNILKALL